MTRRILLISLLALAAAGAFSAALAQKPVSQGAAVTETAVMVAIDSTNRLITLKDDDGEIAHDLRRAGRAALQ